MKAKIFLMIGLIFIDTTCFSQTGNSKQDTLPRNLNEAMNYIVKAWPQTELNKFKNTPENVAVGNADYSTGLWIRNAWIRNNGDQTLIKYFQKIGISVPDDISAIILTSLHRKLNGQNIALQK